MKGENINSPNQSVVEARLPALATREWSAEDDGAGELSAFREHIRVHSPTGCTSDQLLRAAVREGNGSVFEVELHAHHVRATLRRTHALAVLHRIDLARVSDHRYDR